MHSERETEEIIRRNGKKLKKICTDETSEQLVDERFQNLPIFLLQQEFDVNPFKKKSNFNPKGGAAIEMYLSRWEGKILFLDEKKSYSNQTKEERSVLYLLHDNPSSFTKEADKGSAVAVCDREDYLREANSQLSDKDVYREVKRDAEGPLMKVIKNVLRNILNRAGISDEILDYFLVNNLKFR